MQWMVLSQLTIMDKVKLNTNKAMKSTKVKTSSEVSGCRAIQH